jgi:hypothetical protein
MQDSGCWYPRCEDRSKLLPLLPRALTTTNQYVTPQSIDAISESLFTIFVPGIAGDSRRLYAGGPAEP